MGIKKTVSYQWLYTLPHFETEVLGNQEIALKFHSWNECQYQGEIGNNSHAKFGNVKMVNVL